MDIITGKILKLKDWQDGKSIGLAKEAGNKMIANGMDRDAALAQAGSGSFQPRQFPRR
jgi:hypothetical protein